MKIFLTGGAGFIGSALARHIVLNTEHEVICIDKLTYSGNLRALSDIKSSKRFFLEKIDICDNEGIGALFDKYKPEGLIHLAAETHVDRSIDNPSDFITTNIFGTYNLLEQSRKYFKILEKDKKKKFLFHHISTDEVFGDLDIKDLSFTEKSRYQPSSPYSASKASSDHLVRSWHRTYELPIVITNCSNNYGFNQFPEKFIPNVIIRALRGLPILVYGDGKQIRDWLFVDDHVEALLTVFNKGAIGETYNIGGMNEVENIEVVKKICEILEELVPNKPAGVANYQDLISFVQDRAGHDKRYAVDTNKINEELRWFPRETFDTGLRKTIHWYVNNSEWWQEIISEDYRLSDKKDKF